MCGQRRQSYEGGVCNRGNTYEGGVCNSGEFRVLTLLNSVRLVTWLKLARRCGLLKLLTGVHNQLPLSLVRCICLDFSTLFPVYLL